MGSKDTSRPHQKLKINPGNEAGNSMHQSEIVEIPHLFPGLACEMFGLNCIDDQGVWQRQPSPALRI